MNRSFLFKLSFAACSIAWAAAVAYLGFTSDPHKQFGGLEHLSIFQRSRAHKDNLITTPAVTVALPEAQPSRATGMARPNVSPSSASVDTATTASILVPFDSRNSTLVSSTLLPHFTILSISGDRALIQHKGAFHNVTQGDTLGSAGVVLSIQRRGREWFVLTETGYIGTQRAK
jgi:hypothetical protein